MLMNQDLLRRGQEKRSNVGVATLSSTPEGQGA